MTKNYRFEISGEDYHGQSWSTKGELTCEFGEVFLKALGEAFDQVTQGKAVYGQPGVGCQGPYTIKRVLIELL